MMVAQVHPFVGLYRIRGAQYGYRGHIINFRQNISDYLKKLPVHPRDLPSTFLFNRQTPAGNPVFIVDAHKILTALLWLKKHNPFYQDIEIDYEILNHLSSFPDICSDLPNCEVEEQEKDDNDIENEIDSNYQK